jgi:hypothetical protein
MESLFQGDLINDISINIPNVPRTRLILKNQLTWKKTTSLKQVVDQSLVCIAFIKVVDGKARLGLGSRLSLDHQIL